METFSLGDKVIIHSTSDKLLNGKEARVMGSYGTDLMIIFFHHLVEGYDPAIVLSKYCLQKLIQTELDTKC